MIKKRGSIILESLISIVILLIIGSIVFGFTINLNHSKKIRDEFDFFERVSYSIENEIKYNIEYNTILECFKLSDYVSLQLNKDYFTFILNNNLLRLGEGDGILIRKIRKSEKGLLEIEVSIYNAENKLVVSRNFVKGDF